MKVSISPIRSEEDFDAAVNRLDEVFHAELGTAEADEREILATLIEAYDRVHYALDKDGNGETFPEYVKKYGYSPGDLLPSIGSRQRVSAILHGHRGLSTQMMRDLNERLMIPLDVMIGWTTEALRGRKSA